MYDDLSKILAKVDALESGNKPEPISKIQELMIDDLTDYIVCPARYYINTNSELKSNKRTVRERSRRALNTLIFQNIGKSAIQSSQIEKITEEVFSGLSYKTIDMDRKDFISSAIHLSNMLADNEYLINGPLIPITFVHKNTVINSDVSFTIKEIRNNFIYPVVIDLSKTRYEPSFNPVIYRAHIVAEHFDVKGTTTNIQVFSIGSDRRWIYDHRKFFNILRLSLRETIEMMRAEMYPVRFGWWCSSCDYKGLCHKRIKHT